MYSVAPYHYITLKCKSVYNMQYAAALHIEKQCERDMLSVAYYAKVVVISDFYFVEKLLKSDF